MSEEQVIRHCAPTLASIKTGNILSCPYATREEMNSSVRAYNRRLLKKGLRVLPLRYRNGIGLIYVYRPNRLAEDLNHHMACELLQGCGYNCGNANHCIRKLIQRLAQEEEFPHEIGLFLSYPPRDVHGFIHRKQEAKCSGLWKVYDDVDSARRTFCQYKKCFAVYWKLWNQGRSIEQLTVPTQLKRAAE